MNTSKPKQIFPDSDTKRWLSNEAEVWRYVPLRTLLLYLDGSLFIPSVGKLRAADPFEGEFYEEIAWFNDAFAERYGNDAANIDEWILKDLCSDSERRVFEINKQQGALLVEILRKHYFAWIRRTRFAWCWFHSYRESAAMWNIYGKQGVAVKSNVGRIAAMLEGTGRDFIFGKMTYVDYATGVSTEFNPEDPADYQLLLRPFFLKRMEYESEKEVRFVTADSNGANLGGILLENLNPQDWISAISLWPKLTCGEERSVRKTIQHFMPQVECSKSELLTGPDEPVDFNDTLDEDRGGLKETTWKEVKDGIPVALKEV